MFDEFWLDEFNRSFRNIHPQLKIEFKEIEPSHYEVSLSFHNEQGEFQFGSVSKILEQVEDLEEFIEDINPFFLVIEQVLLDDSLLQSRICCVIVLATLCFSLACSGYLISTYQLLSQQLRQKD